VQALLHEALWRPGQAEAQLAPSLPRTVEEVSAVMDGGDRLLRQRLSELDPDERRLLREALADPALI
jgi:hypothetical protein